MTWGPTAIARPEPAAARLLSVSARARWWGAGVLVVLALYLYSTWIAPYRVMLRFVRAVAQRDVGTIMALSYPPEREKTQLSPTALTVALDALFPVPVRPLGDPVPAAHHPSTWRGEAERVSPLEGILCQWDAQWADATTGRPLPAAWPLFRYELSSPIILKPTPAGWRVLVGEFLQATCRSRWGVGRSGRRAYVAIARQSGMAGYLDSNDDFHDLAALWDLP
jgi:hypothetical protein